MAKKKSPLRKWIDGYARFVAHHPFIVIIVAVLMTVVAVYGSGLVKIEAESFKDFFPSDLPVIETLDLIEDEFGSTQAAIIVVDIDPRTTGSDEPRDVRDPRVLSYVNVLTRYMEGVDDVLQVESASSVLKGVNDGRLPQSVERVKELSENNALIWRFISEDYQTTLIRLTVTEDKDDVALQTGLQDIIDEIPTPPGLSVGMTGEAIQNPVIDQLIQPDMAKTSRISLIGVLVVLVLLFRSVRFSFLPLVTIVIGLMWTFGFMGLVGFSISSTSSGFVSMIIGIGIDFGIQVAVRYRQERQTSKPEKAMATTLSNVIVPMGTTTLAALIGFRAMALGQLTFLQQLGNIMSFGVLFSMLAALTLIPALLILTEKEKLGKLFKRVKA